MLSCAPYGLYLTSIVEDTANLLFIRGVGVNRSFFFFPMNQKIKNPNQINEINSDIFILMQNQTKLINIDSISNL